MYPEPPPGKGPIDPRGAFSSPPPPGAPGAPGAPGPMGAVPPSRPGPPPPPPPMMPPPIYMMPPPPPRGRGFVRGVFTVLATTILGFSLALNVYFLLTSGLFSGGASLRENTILEGDPAQKVAVIPISGLIDDDAAQRLDRFLRTAEADSNVKGVVLKIDSPGGTVSAADEMYHRIQQFRAARKDVPIVVSQGGLAASGGYYVSCAADYIFAQPSTITGSIGVIMPNYNISKLMQKWGIEDTSLIATGATFKDAGSMTKPPNPQQVAYLQSLIDENFEQFKGIVSMHAASLPNRSTRSPTARSTPPRKPRSSS